MDKQKNNKTRIQIIVDKDLKADADSILDSLGMTQTAAFTMLLKRIVATGKYPVDLELTSREKAEYELQRKIADIPVRKLDSTKKINEWLDETDDE